MLLQYLRLSTRNALPWIWAVCHNKKSGERKKKVPDQIILPYLGTAALLLHTVLHK